MKKHLLSFLLVFLLFETFLNAYVVSEEYPLPGGDYNNIGVKAVLYIDLNITLVNTAPFPKFVIVNPYYNYIIYRENGEVLSEIGNVSYITPSLNTLNYFPGFWINPYETLKVEIRMKNVTLIPLKDYSINFPHGRSVSYEGDNITYVLNRTEDTFNFFYGTVYPQLLMTPKYYFNIQTSFFGRDGNVKVLKYEGEVTLVLENVPDKHGLFKTLFAVGLPAVFEDADIYGFTPKYTMKYSEYVSEFLPGFLNVKQEAKTRNIPERKFNLYSLSSNLLSGKKIRNTEPPKTKLDSFDYPVWIVWLGSTPLEIKYYVSWNNLEKVSTVGRQKEEAFRFILDRRNPK
ncbi:hypothetical protein E3E31_07750 [Thermococcus sp. M39]|uniref:hypothetical protein n=1 Tax=unclassified Thermococcus TaxID=2627626 RepID=UPI0014393816|nr:MULTISPECIES: hypothetical protein [unclassified Thermococcus]NJE08416.1 hypothetical protein [Thermococcus sp. M39]NJE11918.1 hypothetical protein [Thermococcus sp. LS2]